MRGFGNRTGGSFVSTLTMQHGRALAMVLAVGLAIWSRSAEACGMSALGAGVLVGALQALLVVFLLSVISLLSLRAASRAFGRMRDQRPASGLKFAHTASLVGYGISVVGTVLSGGMMLALLLL